MTLPKYAEPIERLMEELGKLPGIGSRTAERLAFHLLKSPTEEAIARARAIHDVKTQIRPCSRCYNLAEGELCAICSDPRRDQHVLCVVEQPKDLLSLESTGVYRGLYHVLLGQIAPLDGVEPEDLTLDALQQRMEAEPIEEVILATNPNVSGDATALHIRQMLESKGVKVSRLARGLPSGGQIEYASTSILSDALNERRQL